MALGAVSGDAKVYVDLLRHYGVAEKQLTELKDKLHQANDLHIDGYGRVELRNLTRFAAQLGLTLPTAQLESALAPSALGVTKLEPLASDFRAVTVSAGEVRTHAERPGPAQLDAKALGSLTSPLQAFLDALTQAKQLPGPVDLRQGGLDSAALLELLGKHGHVARQHLTLAQVESAKQVAYSATGPAYTERDAVLSLDSTLRPIPSAGSSDPAVRFYQKSGFDNFFLRREDDGRSFSLHGFKSQRVLVTLPKGAKAVLIDAEGNQRGLRLPTQRQSIDGASQEVLEIAPEHVRASGKLPAKLDFTLRVIDAAGAPLAEQHLAFDATVGQRSERLYAGAFGYPKKPEFAGGALEDEHFARFVPAPGKNPVPVGQRPEFQLEGQGTFDRLLLQKDGKSFPIAEWLQFGTPPKARQQALKAEGGARLLLDHRSASESHLDHPNYDPKAGFTLRDSFGHAATFDRALSQTNQAFWDHRGLRVVSGQKTHTVDPLNPA